MFSLIDKLNKLREEVHDWERLKNEETAKEPEEIDVEIQSLTNVVDDIFFSYDRKERLWVLESKRGKILRQKEETLRQKNIAI